MSMRLLVLLGLTCLLALPAAADNWQRAYTVSARPDIRVDADDGHVTVSAGADNQVSARVETEGWRINDSQVRVTAQQTGNSISLGVRIPRMRWSFGEVRSIRIYLQVPRETDLRINTGDGHVDLTSVSGRVEVRTGDGHMTLDRVHGDIRLSTGDGHITASSLDGHLDASTNDGHIDVDGRFDQLNLRTGDGRIAARVRPGSKNTSMWSVRTGDGSISIDLPSDFAANLDAFTNDGRITVDWPVTVSGSLSGKSVRGRLNGGGPSLTVRTGDGSIHVGRL